MEDVKSVITDLGKAFEEFKKTNDQRLSEIDKRGSELSDTKEKLERIELDMDQFSDLKARLDRLSEDSVNRKEIDENPICRRHVEAFSGWIRNPKDHDAYSAAKAAQAEAMEARPEYQKAVSIGSAAGGGLAVPEILLRQIENKVKDISPFRQFVNVQTAASADFRALVNTRGESSGWVGENSPVTTTNRTATNTPQLAEVKPTFGTLYAYVSASEESLNDLFFDVAGWLVENISEEFAQAEGLAIVGGNGTNRPTGFLSADKVLTADGTRDFGDIQYFQTGAAGGFDATAPGDVLFDAVYGLKPAHRQNGRWAMSRNTLSQIRKFKDAEEQYLWQPGLAQGQPGTLLGYPVLEAEAMPGVGTDEFPIAFADWSRAYMLVDLVGMRMTVDDNITTPGAVKWYIRRRLGGKLYNDDAIKLIKCEAPTT